MPLRVSKGLDIPVRRAPGRELLSGFLTERVAVLPAGAPPEPGELNDRLGVQTVSQRPRDEWCWAACAEMVLRFFGVTLDKCQVAGRALRRNDCCPSSVGCDAGLDVGQVDEAFERAGLAGNRFDALTFDEVRDQIEGRPALGDPGLSLPRRPVVAGIQWQNGGGHLVVVSGWRVAADSIRYLKVNDPFYTSGDIRYQDLQSHYGPNDNGRWVHTWADLRRV
ncbi:MAG: hypothetical protein M3348_03865 [Acidobacteriota bacterium]|nr:hypothetical protein [Acidobacteriota bacterium]